MRNHGVVIFERFYEWVFDKSTGKKKVVSFKPRGMDYMLAPVLFDFWQNPKDRSKSIASFAIITREPPKEVLDAGHDRCPVFINPDRIDRWMNPQSSSKDAMLSLLKDIKTPYYDCYDDVP